MKNEVLEALLEAWEKASMFPDRLDESPEAEIGNARNDGFRKGIMTCRDDLESLIQILGD